MPDACIPAVRSSAADSTAAPADPGTVFGTAASLDTVHLVELSKTRIQSTSAPSKH